MAYGAAAGAGGRAMRLRRVVDGDRRVVAVHHEPSDSWVDLDAAAARNPFIVQDWAELGVR